MIHIELHFITFFFLSFEEKGTLTFCDTGVLGSFPGAENAGSVPGLRNLLKSSVESTIWKTALTKSSTAAQWHTVAAVPFSAPYPWDLNRTFSQSLYCSRGKHCL